MADEEHRISEAMRNKETFEKGVEAGLIEARLAGHDRRLSEINGNIKKFAEEIHTLTLAMSKEVREVRMALQHLTDEQASAANTVVTTAAALRNTVAVTAQALKDAKEAEDSAAARRWSPIARVLAVLGGIAAIGTIISLVILFL